MVNKRKRNPPTELNEYDRKILGKYTGYYTNMIESNTAKTDSHESQSYTDKE